MDPFELDQHFFSLVSMFASACWQQLGKMPDQVSGETAKDLRGARATIDMMLMLRDKTRGNLTGTEAKLLGDTISTLEASYEEEAGQDLLSQPVITALLSCPQSRRRACLRTS